jgi:signal transduction histidine kinase/CheY-like chemotaxis protein
MVDRPPADPPPGLLATLGRELALREKVERQQRALDESDRGLAALQDEIDAKDDTLRQSAAVRSRLIANVSHEFRTPLASIMGLCRLLLSRADGGLSEEQEKQLLLLRNSAESLSEVVENMLDLTRTSGSGAVVRPVRFAAADFLALLRGMMRPLPRQAGVELRVEEPEADFALETDQAKLAQVLRNLISNALKFTERGEVVVRAERREDAAVFTVRDTGVGIAPADQERIFEEFVQVENPLQRRVKGSGLGLPLARRLVEAIGGTIRVESRPGAGSIFTVAVPIVHPEVREIERLERAAARLDPARSPVLVVEDDSKTLFLYEKYLSGSGFQVIPARSLDDARQVLSRLRPAAVVLDVVLEGESSWSFLAELKRSPATRDIPALVVTVTDREQKARALGADEFCVKPIDQDWLLRRLRQMSRLGPVEKVLVVDDDPAARYLIRHMLAGSPYHVLEASTAEEAQRLAREERPQVVFLDFVLREATAFDVLDALKSDPRTRDIPVIVQTARDLGPEERDRLRAADAVDVLSRQALSRELAIHRIREALVKVAR